MNRFRLTTPPKQAGFTIVELMIATMVFSVILLVITAGILHFTTDYYKGINSSTTQTVAANTMNSITQSIQFGNINEGDLTTDPDNNYICAGQQEFFYNLGTLDSSTSGLYTFNLDGNNCTGAPGTDVPTEWAKRQDLLQPNMRLARLDVAPNDDGTWNVNIVVAFANGGDLLCIAGSSNPDEDCSGHGTMTDSEIKDDTTGDDGSSQLRCKSQAGSQFCSVVALSSTVQARLED